MIHHLSFENKLIWIDSFRHLKGYIVPHLLSMKIQIWKFENDSGLVTFYGYLLKNMPCDLFRVLKDWVTFVILFSLVCVTVINVKWWYWTYSGSEIHIKYKAFLDWILKSKKVWKEQKSLGLCLTQKHKIRLGSFH